MNKKAIVIIAVIVSIVAVAGGLYMIKFGAGSIATDNMIADIERDNSNEYITIYHSYNDGIHSYRGNVNLPTPCHDLAGDVLVAESFPEQVTIRLTSDNISDLCVQMVTLMEFEVTANASSEAVLKDVYLNGKRISFIIENVSVSTEASKMELETGSTTEYELIESNDEDIIEEAAGTEE